MTPEEQETKVKTTIAIVRLLITLEIEEAKETGGLDSKLADDPNFISGAIFGAIIVKQRLDESMKRQKELRTDIDRILDLLEKQIKKGIEKN
jgi:hypothetical protein